MAEKLEFKSPIATARLSFGSLTLIDETASARVLVRGEASGLDVIFGQSERRSDDVLVCGSRPSEWILIGDLAAASAIAESVPIGEFVTVVDQTHSRAMIRLTGVDAPKALEKLCSADFGDHMTPNGAVLSASIAKVTCDIVRDDCGSEQSYLLIFDRSFGGYMFDAVGDACVEFG